MLPADHHSVDLGMCDAKLPCTLCPMLFASRRLRKYHTPQDMQDARHMHLLLSLRRPLAHLIRKLWLRLALLGQSEWKGLGMVK